MILGILFNLIKIHCFNIFNILASQEGHLEIVQFLIDNKAEVNLQTINGSTALSFGILLNFDLNLNNLF